MVFLLDLVEVFVSFLSLNFNFKEKKKERNPQMLQTVLPPFCFLLGIFADKKKKSEVDGFFIQV